MEGFLAKYATGKSSSFFSFKNWKERFFMVDEKSLKYFENKGGQLKGEVPWANVTYLHSVVTEDAHEAAVDHAAFYFGLRFEIYNENAKPTDQTNFMLLLRSKTELQRRMWLEALTDKLLPFLGNELVDAIGEEEEEIERGLNRTMSRAFRAADRHSQTPTAPPPAASSPTPTSPAGGSEPASSPTSPAADLDRTTSSKDQSMQGLLKNMVSKKKKRFQQDGFDLDLCYITDNIIAMGFPSEGREAIYRNSYADVEKFFTKFHGPNYHIYNLCIERAYEKARFNGQFTHFPFEDHNPPPLSLFPEFCEHVHSYLSGCPERVAAIHCKAGKGRTGTMICAYLVYNKQCADAQEALDFFAEQRTMDGQGVTICSQIRYVHYYGRMMKEFHGGMPPPRKVKLTSVKFRTVPHFDVDGGCDPFFLIFKRSNDSKLEQVANWRDHNKLKHYKPQQTDLIDLACNMTFEDDVKFCFFDYDALSGNDPMFHMWINTRLLPDSGEVSFTKWELDEASKDKSHELFDENFLLTLKFDIL